MSDKEEINKNESYEIIAEITLSRESAERFTLLSHELKEDIAALYMRCANEKCEEYLDQYKNNLPEDP